MVFGIGIIAGKGRSLVQSRLEELRGNKPWSFLTRVLERILVLHDFKIAVLGACAGGQMFGQDTIIHRDNIVYPGLTIGVFCNERRLAFLLFYSYELQLFFTSQTIYNCWQGLHTRHCPCPYEITPCPERPTRLKYLPFVF